MKTVYQYRITCTDYAAGANLSYTEMKYLLERASCDSDGKIQYHVLFCALGDSGLRQLQGILDDIRTGERDHEGKLVDYILTGFNNSLTITVEE